MASSNVHIPKVDVFGFLFDDQRNRSFPQDQVIFRSTTSARTYTHNSLRDRAVTLGSNLITHWNWKRGDVLVIFSPNSIETPAVIWGCHFAGGIVSPANPEYNVKELLHHLRDSEARAIVTHVSRKDVAVEAAKLAGISLDRVLIIEETTENSTDVGLQRVDQMICKPTSKVARPILDPDTDVAFLVYSSGTTGLPKGAMITHSNVVAAMVLQGHVESRHLDWKSDRLLALLPMYHIYGLVCLVHLPMYLGLETMVMESFSVHAFKQLIEDYKVSHVYVAPPVVLHLAKDPVFDQADLSSLKMLTSGGAPLSEELIRAVYNRLQIPVRQAFGLTETTAVCHIQRWDAWETAMGSNGPPLPQVEVKFIQENEEIVTNGEGELCIRGPTIFKGYYKNPASTKRSITSDGWFRTGDIGYQDKGGNLFITDRSKDLIKYKGYQVAPAEIEALLQSHPLVRDAAVIGIFNEVIASELPLAYISLKNPEHATEETAKVLIQHVTDRVLRYKRLRGGIIWTDRIPKSPSGKILKRILRERASTVDKKNVVQSTKYDDTKSSKL